jgi:hypothetical protein
VAEPEPNMGQDTEVFPDTTTSGEPPARRREVERTPLIAGVLFIVLAIVLMSGVDLSAGWFSDGLGWVLLIGGGLALLVSELRRARHRH